MSQQGTTAIKTTFIKVEGITLWVPSFLVDLWPREVPLAGFPSYCGAGSGIGDKIVPEYIWGLKVSAACFIHDILWAICPNTWAWFILSNLMFLFNLLSIIKFKSHSFVGRIVRYSRAVWYFIAVSTIGKKCFKKDAEDKVIVDDPTDHPSVIAKFNRIDGGC